MRDPRPIDTNDPAALHAWGAEARDIIAKVRIAAFDAAAPRGERRHARRHLRTTLRSLLRALEVRIDAIDPAPTSTSSAPAPEAPAD